MRLNIANLIVFSLLLAAHTLAASEQVLRMATSTNTENSGLFAVIQPVFEKALDIKVHLIAVAIGKALELGRRGDVDVVLVHAATCRGSFCTGRLW